MSANCQTAIPEQQVDKIFSIIDKKDSPGASIAIVRNGKLLFKKGYGTASLEYDIPVTPSTVFQVASVSKQVTAFAVLLLENEGKLSLGDDVRKYIPEFPDFGKVITIGNLIYHTSGLRDYWELLAMAGWRYDDVLSRRQVLEMVYRQKGLNFTPGYEHFYSNTGYLILAEIVSRVSGQSFSDFTRDKIFVPLKMVNTTFLDDNERIIKGVAASYSQWGDGYKKSLLNNPITGSTNLHTSVEDMSKWMMNFDYPVVGNKTIIKKMNTRGTIASGDTINYAMGLATGLYRGIMLIGHSGAEGGYRSFSGRFPDHSLSIIVLSNNSSVDPAGLGLRVADIILKDKFPPVNPQAEQTVRMMPDEYTGDSGMLTKYEGRYELRPGYVITVTSENDRLFAEAHEVPKSILIRKSESDFILPAMRAGLKFTGDNPGEISRLVIDLNGQQMNAPKIRDFDASAVNPAEYTGVFYRSERSI